MMKEVKYALYVLLVVVATVAGYYIGQSYAPDKANMGAAGGLVVGLLLSGGLYYYNERDSMSAFSY